MDFLPLQFDRSGWLLLLLLIVPTYLFARRSIGGLSRAKATLTFALRVFVILLLSLAMAQPIWEKRGEGLTVTVILDRSQSIPLPLMASFLNFMRTATDAPETRKPEDRVAVITVARDSSIAAMPDRYTAVTPGQDVEDRTATNLASAVRLALAIMPDDTANRIVLVTDGNETEDSVLEAAQIAQANKVPIDVILIKYVHAQEVIFERIVAPARARLGQSANIKLVLHSQAETTGTVFLSMGGVQLDLNGEQPGNGLHITLPPGSTVLPVTISLDSPGPQKFESVFEPDDLSSDRIDRNNTAVAVTFVGSEGKIMVVENSPDDADHLIRALEESEITVDRTSPAGVGDLVELSAYDCIVLANIPRWSFDDDQVRDLHAYIHDLGGGLVMLGGPTSFGAGGWIDSDLAKALPVRLDPPQSRQMVRGALALIMHSCEMPQGNFWGQKVAQSAIEALSSLDYCGIVEFNWGGGRNNINGTAWAFPMQIVGNKSAAMSATKTMVVGDMPDFGSSMQLALQGLTGIRAGQKHAIIISDGDPSPPSKQLLQSYVDAQITVTTVMVAGHGSAIDRNNMKAVADITGGNFYNVTNPKNLPQIFIKEAQLVSRSLIQEGEIYQPVIISRLPGPLEGFDRVPSIDGYVLTAPREGLAQVPMVNATSEGNDPIFAYWNYGLGKSVAWTSDITGRWGSRWVSWSEFKNFWEQSIRWTMRPSSPHNMIVNTRMEGELAIVEIEALEADASFLDFLQTQAVVLDPDSEVTSLDLQQTGPGRYRAEFETDKAGAYLININYAGGSVESPIRGNLQAAVTVPYSREFRAVRHNAALMEELTERTGGRMIQSTNAALVDLFNRDDLEIPKSPKYIWDLLTIIAASLFLLDIAARRISVDPKWVAALFGRAVKSREDASMDTVAAWRRAKAQVSHRQEKSVSTIQTADVKMTRRKKFEADEESSRYAIDVESDMPQDVRESDAVKPSRVSKKPEETEDEGDFTSRLLAARRRAQESDSDGKKGDGDA